MGAILHAVWAFGCVHFQPAPFLPTDRSSILGAPDLVSESRSVLVKSGDLDDAICLSAILAGRQTALDHGHGAAGAGADRASEILARRDDVVARHTCTHRVVLPHA